jgi:hypothetical protein
VQATAGARAPKAAATTKSKPKAAPAPAIKLVARAPDPQTAGLAVCPLQRLLPPQLLRTVIQYLSARAHWRCREVSRTLYLAAKSPASWPEQLTVGREIPPRVLPFLAEDLRNRVLGLDTVDRSLALLLSPQLTHLELGCESVFSDLESAYFEGPRGSSPDRRQLVNPD